MALGTTIGSLGAFVEPIRQDFGWTGEQMGSALTAFVLAMAAILPMAGLLVDRIGARVVMTCGTVLIATSYGLASRSQTLTALVAGFAATGAGLGAATYVPCTVVISEWVPDRRGLALGVLLAVSAVGATLLPIAIAPLVRDHGWRPVMAGIAYLNLLIGLPIILALARRGTHGHEKRPISGGGPPLPELMRGRTFRLVTLVLVLSQLSFYGIYFHLIPFLTDLGFPESKAVLFYSGSALATFAGSMVLGPLIDRFGPRRVLIAALSVLVCGCLLLPGIDTSSAGIAVGVAFSVLWGAVVNSPLQFAPILLADAAGPGNLGTLLGLSNFLTGLVSAFGPVLTGAIHDATQSYMTAFGLSAVIAALSIVPALRLPK